MKKLSIQNLAIIVNNKEKINIITLEGKNEKYILYTSITKNIDNEIDYNLFSKMEFSENMNITPKKKFNDLKFTIFENKKDNKFQLLLNNNLVYYLKNSKNIIVNNEKLSLILADGKVFLKESKMINKLSENIASNGSKEIIPENDLINNILLKGKQESLDFSPKTAQDICKNLSSSINKPILSSNTKNEIIKEVKDKSIKETKKIEDIEDLEEKEESSEDTEDAEDAEDAEETKDKNIKEVINNKSIEETKAEHVKEVINIESIEKTKEEYVKEVINTESIEKTKDKHVEDVKNNDSINEEKNELNNEITTINNINKSSELVHYNDIKNININKELDLQYNIKKINEDNHIYDKNIINNTSNNTSNDTSNYTSNDTSNNTSNTISEKTNDYSHKKQLELEKEVFNLESIMTDFTKLFEFISPDVKNNNQPVKYTDNPNNANNANNTNNTNNINNTNKITNIIDVKPKKNIEQIKSVNEKPKSEIIYKEHANKPILSNSTNNYIKNINYQSVNYKISTIKLTESNDLNFSNLFKNKILESNIINKYNIAFELSKENSSYLILFMNQKYLINKLNDNIVITNLSIRNSQILKNKEIFKLNNYDYMVINELSLIVPMESHRFFDNNYGTSFNAYAPRL